MLSSPADTITSAHILALLDEQVSEGRNLDYKRELKLSAQEERKELARDVSAFANADGGFLVFGVAESGGTPVEICGIAATDYDALIRQIDNIIRDGVRPRIRGVTIAKVDIPDKDPVVVVHVPRSWTGPHMASAPNQSHFYSRNAAGKYPLDVQEIRAAFVAGTDVAARIERFRDERLARIVAGRGGMPLWGGGPKLVVHAHPLENATTVFDSLAGDVAKLPPWREGGHATSSRFNLDGFITHPTADANHPSVYCYTMALRSGAFERCEPIGLDTKEKPHRAFGDSIERDIFSASKLFIDRTRDGGVDGPVILMVSLLGVDGIRLERTDADRDPWVRPHVIDRDVLILPDVPVEDRNVTGAVLRPLFDALWQASGWRGSPDFDAAGNWKPRGV